MSRTDVLVDADWAENHLNDPTVVFVEVDEDVSAYDTGHIAGAVRLDWSTELQEDGVRDVIDRATFSELLSAKGISNDDTVVLYGGNNNWFAAYAYWYLKLYGHRDVRLLDGGRKKWELDGRPLTTDVTERPRAQYEASEQDLSIRAFSDEVRDAIGTKNLVDVRSPDEFSGKIAAPAHLPQEAGARLGHVPTAVNLPWSQAANDDGTFKSADELRALYADAGLDPAKEVIAYCRIGERSSHSWFVLRELLGYTSAKNYDGSYLEWSAQPELPVHNPQATDI
ncbi:sulfurtransferase [Nocardioides deserti]|uniref:thiosulfate sulfurtransferase n=1 Tax=Nocardioides deserti TaxID=1588644 RepID=A0ABR6U7Q1_9ACTN|nr:sulfurtransferase [Nocardioides deserti]MBC2960158.1 sulfurtransferase [Nocardioides deserti]GGO74752.1 sulfurtransferase [Nocardioides deserti]